MLGFFGNFNFKWAGTGYEGIRDMTNWCGQIAYKWNIFMYEVDDFILKNLSLSMISWALYSLLTISVISYTFDKLITVANQ